MRPGQLTPNSFETALLGQLAYCHPALQTIVPSLHVLSREFTGVGSFTEFLVKDHPEVKRQVLDCLVTVRVPGLQLGLGFLAFWEANRLTLETYTFGDEKWDGVYDGFVFETAA